MKNLEHIFYHGTSSIFLDSIKAHGLGGVNPNKDYLLLELLKFLFDACEKFLLNEPEYLKLRQATQAMVLQAFLHIPDGPRPVTHNFRHDNIYLAYSKHRALAYAMLNEFGSEILTRAVTLYRLLEKGNRSIYIPDDINQIQLEKVAGSKYFPILIEISSVDESSLRLEDGRQLQSVLSELLYGRYFYTDEKFQALSQQRNFELVRPVSPEKLRFFQVSFQGSIHNQETFSYELLAMH
ncbi:hypothetical protein [Polluticoccus soli]|uniref:hypothetical protein n=1 Tax=Polluticoccus soli TaxID=3034150 RepID=UPI0023E2B685|nr:hypothetical protein [Flavipsychrobacter sp. JY13-12]